MPGLEFAPSRDLYNIQKLNCSVAATSATPKYLIFGMQMPGRSYQPGDYRFGFGGQEADDEITGSRSHYTAESWEYDSRVVRRWNVDPRFREYASQSPYACFNGNPILFNDPTGEGGEITINTANKTINIKAKLYLYSDGNVTNEQIENALESHKINKTSTARIREYSHPGEVSELGGVDYTISYQIDIEVVSSEQAAALQEGKNVTDNFFEVRESLPVPLGTAVISGSGQGQNIGILTIDGLNNAANQENFIAEEVWHTMAGANYDNPGDESHSNKTKKQYGVCDGFSGDPSNVTSTDINAVLKAAKKGGREPNVSEKKRGSTSKFTSGGDAGRLVNQNDYDKNHK